MEQGRVCLSCKAEETPAGRAIARGSIHHNGPVIYAGFEKTPITKRGLQGRIFPLFISICTMSKEISIPDPQIRKDKFIISFQPLKWVWAGSGCHWWQWGFRAAMLLSWHHPNQSEFLGGPFPHPESHQE